VNLTFNGYVGGNYVVDYSSTHPGMSVDATIQRKRVSDSGYSNFITTPHHGCINCDRIAGFIPEPGGLITYNCTHNALYRVHLVFAASGHPTQTVNVGARVLC